MKLSLYDIRILYEAYTTLNPAKLLMNVGAMSLIDSSDSEEEKIEIISLTMDVLAGIAGEVKNANTPDYSYMQGEITSTERDARHRELRKSRAFKSLASIFEYAEVSTSSAVTYMVQTAQGKVPEISATTYILELRTIKKYLASAVSPVDSGSLLALLNMKEEEVTRLRRIQQGVAESSDVEAIRSMKQIDESMEALDKELRHLTQQIEDAIPASHARVRAHVSSLLDHRAQAITALNERLEAESLSLEKEISELVEGVHAIKNAPQLDAVHRIREALSVLNQGLDNIANAPKSDTDLAEIASLADRALASANSIATPNARAKINMSEIRASIQSLRQLAETNGRHITELSNELPAIANIVDVISNELRGYQNTILSSTIKMQSVKERTKV